MEEIARRPGAAGVILFLHGLDGGPLKTWGMPGHPGTFPLRLGAARPYDDVLSLGYPARPLDYTRRSGLTIPRVATELATTFAQLAPRYRRLDIVAHCMGGLVAIDALRRCWQANASQAGRLAALDLRCVLLDAPLLIGPTVPPHWLARMIVRLGIDDATLELGVDWLRRVRPMRCIVATSSLPGWVRYFQPNAAGRTEDRHVVALSHDAISRAPLEGTFAPLTITLQALERQVAP